MLTSELALEIATSTALIAIKLLLCRERRPIPSPKS